MALNMTKYVDRLTSTWSSTALSSLAAVTCFSIAWVAHDYRAWLNFGTGGTPPTFHGYLKITKFRLLRMLSGDSLADPTPLSTNGPSYLDGDLPERMGPRPRMISRTLPQRQYPAPLDASTRKRLHDLPSKYAALRPDLLTLELSLTEGKSTLAIYARPELPGRKLAPKDNQLGNEIAHVHPAEDSLHVWLAQADAKKVVAAGRGLRFPLSSLKICDDGWTFVYAPTTMEDVDVIERIIKAGIGHLTGERV